MVILKKANKNREIPVLAAFERNNMGDLAAWCPYCQAWHYHSAPEGFRTAHCVNSGSPFIRTGYILKRVRLPGEGG